MQGRRGRLIWIELLGERLDVVLVRNGSVVDGRREPITMSGTSGESEEWGAAVRELGPRLKALVDDMKVEGCPARILYRSPTAAVDFSSFALRTPALTREAALLACTGGLPYPARSAVYRAAVIGRDRRGAPRRYHAVVAADRNDMIVALAKLVESAGLTFEGATPAGVGMLAVTARRALRSDVGAVGWLHIGEDASCLAIADEGRLEFVRPLGMGLSSLVAGLMRPVQVDSGDTIELTREAATTILLEHGIPDPKTVVDPATGLTGGRLRPLIQPTLQRCMVELRQSLRFGVGEDRRADLRIVVGGPGATLPGLGPLLAQELGVDVEVESTREPSGLARPGSAGSALAASMNEPTTGALQLVPLHVEAARRVTTLRHALWVGAAAGVAFVVFDGMSQSARLDRAREESEVVEQETLTLAALEERSTRVIDALSTIRRLDTRIEAEMEHGIAVGPILQEVGLLTPPEIRLTRISLVRSDGGSVIEVSGVLLSQDVGAPSHRLIARYVDALRDSPLIADVRLAGVEAGAMSARDGRRFDLGIEPAELSRAVRAALVAGAPS